MEKIYRINRSRKQWKEKAVTRMCIITMLKKSRQRLRRQNRKLRQQNEELKKKLLSRASQPRQKSSAPLGKPESFASSSSCMP